MEVPVLNRIENSVYKGENAHNEKIKIDTKREMINGCTFHYLLICTVQFVQKKTLFIMNDHGDVVL